MTRTMSADGSGGYHPHESPLTDARSDLPLALGALLAGQLFHGVFIDAETRPEYWHGSIAFSRELAEAAEILGLVGQAHADHRHADRPVDRLEQLHPRPGRSRPLRRDFPGVYQFVSNKWYFDELYDASSCVPRCGSAACSGTAVTRARSTASVRMARPMRSASATASPTGSRSGYLYSYALVMLLGLIGAASWAIWWAK